MQKTLGGERLGTGKKIKVDLHSWGRSTFNQSRIWRSTMGVGSLVPCFVEIGTNGTTFDIDINTLGHTIPTIAPLFGSYKLQVDMFACPIRLYQGLLHNNAVNIGLDMSQVLLPNIIVSNLNRKKGKTNPSSLLNYLGIKGFTDEKRNFNALPILAYYDIFKNYYANKQEKYAKVIGHTKQNLTIPNFYITFNEDPKTSSDYFVEFVRMGNPNSVQLYTSTPITSNSLLYFVLDSKINNTDFLKVDIYTDTEQHIKTKEGDRKKVSENIYEYNLYEGESIQVVGKMVVNNENQTIRFTFLGNSTGVLFSVTQVDFTYTETKQDIYDFELENIDNARREILKKTDKLIRLNLNTDVNFLPYSVNFENDDLDSSKKELNGLCLKTYLSDIYNSWLSNEHIELINTISSVSVGEYTDENGQTQKGFTMDSLILAKKVYNMLNRIAVSGGTYEDWQESVYGENAIKRAESPIYIGGSSAEIQFEEVVSTASVEGEPLGSLGGRGQMTNRKGGNIIYKCEEPTIIIGIASITPRVDYYQGNKWYMTNLDNMNDLHKPGLDGIGFENLIANNVVWSDSTNKALAKQTAWINYQTAVNEVFGYFALDEDEENSLHFMTLRRDFEVDNNGEITDFTTYIDPQKFNKVFASEELTAQNFWMQIGFNVQSRRKMAAYEIPNL